MNWEAVSAISEIIGAIAVVVSLIYVAAQIRQNTKMMRSGAKQSLTETSQNLIYKAIDNPADWVKLVNGGQPESPEQDARMSLRTRAILRGFESQCYQYEVGLLEENEWQALRAAIVDIYRFPGINRYWLELRPHMSARLRKVVEDA